MWCWQVGVVAWCLASNPRIGMDSANKLNELISVPILLRAYVTLGLWFGFSICLVGRGPKRRPIKRF